MSHHTTGRVRRAALASAAILGGAVLALTVPSAASAHVSVTPDQLAAGEHGVLTFSFAHGCENSPTTALRVTIPDGLASVAPTMQSDWSIDIERGDDGLVSAVTYTAAAPVPTDLRGAVSMSVGLDESTPDTLAFPVVQECVDGETEWTQIAEKDQDPHSLDAPAPVVAVSESGSAHDETAPAEPETTSVDPLPTILGSAGLLTGAAALVVSVIAYRRSA